MPETQDLPLNTGEGQTTMPFSGADMLAQAKRNLELARAATNPDERERYFHDAIAGLPADALYDPKSGQIRPKSWWESHVREGLNLEGLLSAAAVAIGGYYASGSSALLSAAPGASDAGTLASLGATGSELTAGGLPATAAAAGGTIASLTGRGGPSDTAPDSSVADPAAASSYAPPTPTSVGPGTPAAVETGGFGAGSAAGVPEALSPTPLVSTPSAAAGAYAPNVAPSGAVQAASGGGSVLSGVGSALSSPLVGGLITAGLQYAQSRANANAAQTASQQEIDAANKALDLQKQEFDLSRGDYLQNQAYTRQQIGGLSPYQDIGRAGLGNLYSLVGRPAPVSLATAQSPAGQPPPAAAAPTGTIADLGLIGNRRPPTAGTPTGQTAVPKMITVRDTATGETQQRPYAELQHWQSVPGAQVTA